MNLDIASILGRQNQARNELNNIRKNIQALKALHKKDISRIEQLIDKDKSDKLINESGLQRKIVNSQSEGGLVTWKPIGYISSWFHSKNGTPRQGSVTSLSRGILKLSKDIFTNPQHSLEGIKEFSYIWIFFIFDRNGPAEKSACNNFMKAKVAPPRLNGQKVGVFASRSPHRPNPLGLTLAKLDSIEGDCLHLSGLDILDGTPIVDIKPYIPEYDQPPQISFKSETVEESDKGLNENKKTDEADTSLELRDNSRLHDKKESAEITSSYTDNAQRLSDDNSIHNTGKQIQCKSKFEKEKISGGSVKYDLPIENLFENKIENKDLINREAHIHTKEVLPIDHGINNVKIAPWLSEPPINQLEVVINPRAEKQILLFASDSHDPIFRLKYLRNSEELYEAICSVLREDPRSIYRRQKCSSQLYYFTVDTAHCTVWFDENIAEVLKVKPALEQE